MRLFHDPTRITAFSAFAVFCLIVAFLMQPISFVDSFLRWGVFWVLLILLFSWIIGMWRLAGPNTVHVRHVLVREKWSLLLVALCSVYIQLHEPHGIKIYPLEPEFLSVARSLHMTRTNAVIEVGHSLGDVHHVVSDVVWKGDCLFPFLVGLVHGISGYRIENVHYLNAIVGFVFLILFYCYCRTMMNQVYSCFAVLCLCGVPLFHEAATGAGSEMVVLCLISGVILFSLRFLQTSRMRDFSMLMLTWALLVCCTVYGWLWLLFPVSVSVMNASEYRRSPYLDWKLIWLFPLLIPSIYVLLYHLESSSAQYSGGFVEHLIMGFGEAVSFLFDFSRIYANAPVFGVFGSVSIVFLLVLLLKFRSVQSSQIRNHRVLLILFFITLAMELIATWIFPSQGWMHPSGSRSALYLYFFMAVSLPYVLSGIVAIRRAGVWCLVAPLVVAFHANGTWADWGAPYRIKDPVMLGRHYLERHTLRKFSSRGTLYLGDGSIEMNAKGWAAMPVRVANKIPERIQSLVDLDVYKNIVVGQYIVDRRGMDQELLSPRFITEPLAFKILADGIGVELSRVIGIRSAVPGDESRSENLAPLPPPPGSSRDASRIYLEELLFDVPQ